MRYRLLFSVCTVLCFALCGAPQCKSRGLAFILWSEKNSYFEEEEIVLKLVIENTSAEDRQIELQYLQPVEKKYLYVGQESYRLDFEFNGTPVERFTNHMPPEPHPGILPVTVRPGEKIVWGVPFPLYYYPFTLPGQFRVKLRWGNIVSNEVTFNVQKSPGMPEDGSINFNPHFSQGKDRLYGWKLHDRKTVWDSEHNRLVFHLDKNTAENEGLWVYSLFYEIEPSTEYELKVRLKSTAPEVIIFVEGCELVNGRKRRTERQECFVHPQKDWEEHTFSFPFQHAIRWVRIKIYSYLYPGDIYFENVSLTKK